jgi:signal transduction histidine kinase
MLQEFIALNRDDIVRRCKVKVAARSTLPPDAAVVDHGVPLFLDQLGDALGHGPVSSIEISSSAIQHGHDLLRQGFTVSQVVHSYGDVCQSITELAAQTGAPMTIDEFRTLNRCLDDAIAGAVTEYGRARNQSTVEGENAREQQRLGFFAHELGNLINTGIIAFEILKAGNVGVGGSTGAVLHRSLMGLRTLVGRSLAELRLTEGVQNKESLLVGGFIEEIAPSAALEATTRGITLVVLPVETAVSINADRQVLAAVVTNLLQNAFKFTKPGTTVTLRVGASEDRVLFEIQDECGGLPTGNADELFHPFEQRGADRTGVGLGLAFCRWAVEANDGRIHARSLPGTGCVFTIDFPRHTSPAVESLEIGVTAG